MKQSPALTATRTKPYWSASRVSVRLLPPLQLMPRVTLIRFLCAGSSRTFPDLEGRRESEVPRQPSGGMSRQPELRLPGAVNLSARGARAVAEYERDSRGARIPRRAAVALTGLRADLTAPSLSRGGSPTQRS
jgi:hypothetical protein